MRIFIILIVIFINILFNCFAEPIQLEVTHTTYADVARIRETPDINGKQIGTIKKGERIELTYVLSENRTEVEINGIKYNAFWAQVKTENGVEGYVYLPLLMDELNYGNIKIQVFFDKFIIFKNNKLFVEQNFSEILTSQSYPNSLYAMYVPESNCIIGFAGSRLPDDITELIIINISNDNVVFFEEYTNLSFSCHGVSKSGKYISFDSGDYAFHRPLQIFSVEKNKFVYDGNPYRAEWDGDRMEMYFDCGWVVPGKPELEHSNDRYYIEKVYWEDEEFTPTGEYEIGMDG